MQCARPRLSHCTAISCGVLDDQLWCSPSRLLAKEEVGIVDTEPDLVAGFSNVAVAQGLERREEKGSRGWQMRNCQADVGDGHCTTAVSGGG